MCANSNGSDMTAQMHSSPEFRPLSMIYMYVAFLYGLTQSRTLFTKKSCNEETGSILSRCNLMKRAENGLLHGDKFCRLFSVLTYFKFFLWHLWLVLMYILGI